jgi:hypothetical protein
MKLNPVSCRHERGLFLLKTILTLTGFLHFLAE